MDPNFEQKAEMKHTISPPENGWESIKSQNFLVPLNAGFSTPEQNTRLPNRTDEEHMTWDEIVDLITLKQLSEITDPGTLTLLGEDGKRSRINQARKLLPHEPKLQQGLERSFEQIVRTTTLGGIRKSTLKQKFLPAGMERKNAQAFVDRFWNSSTDDFASFASRTFNLAWLPEGSISLADREDAILFWNSWKAIGINQFGVDLDMLMSEALVQPALAGQSEHTLAFESLRKKVANRLDQQTKSWWTKMRGISTSISDERVLMSVRFLVELLLWFGETRGDKDFTDTIALTLSENEPITVVDILCLRWVRDRNTDTFSLIEDVDNHQFGDEIFMHEQENLRHILHIAHLAKRNQVPMALTIAVADLDLQLGEHHPKDASIFQSADRFIQSVKAFCEAEGFCDETTSQADGEGSVEVVSLIEIIDRLGMQTAFNLNHARLMRHFELVARGKAKPIIPAFHQNTIARCVDDVKVELLKRPDRVHLINDPGNENRALMLQVLIPMVRDFVLVRLFSRIFSTFIVSTTNARIPAQLNLAQVFTTTIQDPLFTGCEEAKGIMVGAIKHLRQSKKQSIVKDEQDVFTVDTLP